MPSSREIHFTFPTSKKPLGRSRIHRREYTLMLAWDELKVPLDEVEEVAGEKEVCRSLLKQVLLQPGPG